MLIFFSHLASLPCPLSACTSEVPSCPQCQGTNVRFQESYPFFHSQYCTPEIHFSLNYRHLQLLHSNLIATPSNGRSLCTRGPQSQAQAQAPHLTKPASMVPAHPFNPKPHSTSQPPPGLYNFPPCLCTEVHPSMPFPAALLGFQYSTSSTGSQRFSPMLTSQQDQAYNQGNPHGTSYFSIPRPAC